MMMKHRKPTEHQTPHQWATFAKGMLKAELAKRSITYAQLVELLEKVGVTETPENLANKINRGKFSAIFLFQCLDAIGCKVLRLSDD